MKDADATSRAREDHRRGRILWGWGGQGDQEFSLGHTMFGMSARQPSGGAEKADGDKSLVLEKSSSGDINRSQQRTDCIYILESGHDHFSENHKCLSKAGVKSP